MSAWSAVSLSDLNLISDKLWPEATRTYNLTCQAIDKMSSVMTSPHVSGLVMYLKQPKMPWKCVNCQKSYHIMLFEQHLQHVTKDCEGSRVDLAFAAILSSDVPNQVLVVFIILQWNGTVGCTIACTIAVYFARLQATYVERHLQHLHHSKQPQPVGGELMSHVCLVFLWSHSCPMPFLVISKLQLFPDGSKLASSITTNLKWHDCMHDCHRNCTIASKHVHTGTIERFPLAKRYFFAASAVNLSSSPKHLEVGVCTWKISFTFHVPANWIEVYSAKIVQVTYFLEVLRDGWSSWLFPQAVVEHPSFFLLLGRFVCLCWLGCSLLWFPEENKITKGCGSARLRARLLY